MNTTGKIIALCLVISVLSPIASYLYFNQNTAALNTLTSENQSLKNENERLNQEIANITAQLEETQKSLKANLVTEIGWYLHNGTDPVVNSRYKFTIYGSVANTGIEPAIDCKLVIKFYSNQTLVQTSEINLGDIGATDPFNGNNRYYIYQRDIVCSSADSVTNIEITPSWSTN